MADEFDVPLLPTEIRHPLTRLIACGPGHVIDLRAIRLLHHAHARRRPRHRPLPRDHLLARVARAAPDGVQAGLERRTATLAAYSEGHHA